MQSTKHSQHSLLCRNQMYLKHKETDKRSSPRGAGRPIGQAVWSKGGLKAHLPTPTQCFCDSEKEASTFADNVRASAATSAGTAVVSRRALPDWT